MINEVLLTRSVMFVPGSEPRRIQKTLEVPADILVFDLEDAVSPNDKARAREIVVEALASKDFAERQVLVRVNGVSSPWFKADMQALADIDHHALMLPKCESIADLKALESFVEKDSYRLFAIIETALGVLKAADIAEIISTENALCFGHVDFSADMGLNDNDASTGSIYHARCQLALAAKAYGVKAIDNICLNVRDEGLIRQDALLGQQLGYDGKLCIHPYQVSIVNEVYTPSIEQVKRAESILDAWEIAQQQGQGVFVFENKMIDLPVIIAQQSVLRRAQAAGVISADKTVSI